MAGIKSQLNKISISEKPFITSNQQRFALSIVETASYIYVLQILNWNNCCWNTYTASTDGWKTQEEFKAWLERLAEDFTFASTDGVSDEELVALAADVQGSNCGCGGCRVSRAFLDDPAKFAALIPSSRMERLHAHTIINREKHVSWELRPNGLVAIKLNTHPHASASLQLYYRELGKQGLFCFHILLILSISTAM